MAADTLLTEIPTGIPGVTMHGVLAPAAVQPDPGALKLDGALTEIRVALTTESDAAAILAMLRALREPETGPKPWAKGDPPMREGGVMCVCCRIYPSPVIREHREEHCPAVRVLRFLRKALAGEVPVSSVQP